jgi:hypothetical protein
MGDFETIAAVVHNKFNGESSRQRPWSGHRAWNSIDGEIISLMRHSHGVKDGTGKNSNRYPNSIIDSEIKPLEWIIVTKPDLYAPPGQSKSGTD